MIRSRLLALILGTALIAVSAFALWNHSRQATTPSPGISDNVKVTTGSE